MLQLCPNPKITCKSKCPHISDWNVKPQVHPSITKSGNFQMWFHPPNAIKPSLSPPFSLMAMIAERCICFSYSFACSELILCSFWLGALSECRKAQAEHKIPGKLLDTFIITITTTTIIIIIIITIMIKIIGFETATYHNRSYYVIIFNIYISIYQASNIYQAYQFIYIYIYTFNYIHIPSHHLSSHPFTSTRFKLRFNSPWNRWNRVASVPRNRWRVDLDVFDPLAKAQRRKAGHPNCLLKPCTTG